MAVKGKPCLQSQGISCSQTDRDNPFFSSCLKNSFQNPLDMRTLQGNHPDFIGFILNDEALELLLMFKEPIQISPHICCIHNKKIICLQRWVPFLQPIEIGIIDRATVLILNESILGDTRIKSYDIVR